MRKLMWFALGFAAASGVCAYCWLTEGLKFPALIALVLFAGILFFGKNIRWLRCAAAVCLGCAAGLLWFQFYASSYLYPAARLDERHAFTTIYCTDYSYETAYGTSVEGAFSLDGKYYRTKVYLDKKISLEPADTLCGKFEFRVTTPDGSDEPTAHQGKGIFLLAYEEDNVTYQKSQDRPLWTIPARLRRNLLDILDQYFPKDTAFFAKALLLGDRSGIDYETNTAFKISGISHVIAVSGLHVTILFSLINVLCFKRRYLVTLIGIPVLVVFAAAAGLSPSITRACIMQSLMILSMVLNREYDGFTELAFACLVMLIVNPLVITSVSFQLSCGCMVGIFLFSGRIRTYLTEKFTGKGKFFAKVSRWIIGSVSVTLGAMIMTTPLVAYYFRTVSLIGVVTNLLTLWVISLIFYGIMAVCAFGIFWPAAASVTAWIIAWPVRYVLTLSKALASLPLAAVYTASIYVVIWLVFCYLLLIVHAHSKKKHTAVFTCCMITGLCIALCASWFEPLTDHCRLTVLDVGQGQCVLLQSEGKTILVDCGGDNAQETADTAAEYLLSQGISNLDAVILTHYDADHSGGMEYLLSRVSADVLFVPDCTDEKGVFHRLAPLAAQTVKVNDDLLFAYSETEISIFGPVTANSGNESSLAILFHHDNCDILIAGDRSAFGERVLLKTAQIPKVDTLVVGHHGSKYSTSAELLQAVMPKTAVISVGENSYGHPAQEVQDRLAANNCEILRTDLCGNIILRR